MATKVRFVLVGVGPMGRENGRRILETGRGRIVAVCDPNVKAAKAYAATLGVKAVYSDAETLLASRVRFDAAVISVPNLNHAPLSVAFLEAGKSVFCEKPPAIDAAAARSVVEAEKKAKGVFMVGFNQRFDDWAQHLKGRIKAGDLGRIYYAQTQWHRRRWTATFGSWFTNAAASGGGPLIDIGVHRLDQTLWLMGFPKVLSVSGVTYDFLARDESRRSGKPYSVEDFAVALIKLEGEATLILQTSYLSYLPLDAAEMSTLLMGKKCGYLQEGNCLRKMINRNANPSDVMVTGFDVPPITPMGHFIDCVISGDRPLCTAEQGLAVMEVIEAIYRSGETGREVVLDQQGD